MMHRLLSRLPILMLLPLAGATAAPAVQTPAPSCVPHALVLAPIATDDGHVLFRGQTDPKRSYVAVFKGEPCAGLDRFATLQVETMTSLGYCGGDRLRVLRLPTTIPGPFCVIDRLKPVDAAFFDDG